MPVQLVPTSTDKTKPIYTQITALDGSEYQLAFEWNQRNGLWFLTVRDQNGQDIVSGVALVDGWPLTLGVLDPRLPDGTLIVYDLRKKHDTFPGLTDLGNRWELHFITEA